jgi:6-pyruvoyltetrahydropterin/6-carboxytetrahydropterin synthase
VSRGPAYTLRLAKQDFKFAAAHFTLFPDGSGELLHGHNYRVRVEIGGDEPGPHGLLVEVAHVKACIRAACADLDERTLIPEKSPLLALRSVAEGLEIRLGDRSYRLPADDVKVLPLENVSVELLARMLWEQLAPVLGESAASELLVEVEETDGQSCAYRAALASGG